MSDLITTTQDATREALISAYFGVRGAGVALVERAKQQEGQTAAEYMGVLFLVAAIITAIIGLKVPGHIATGIQSIVDSIGGKAPAE
jgi:hypothetical protein